MCVKHPLSLYITETLPLIILHHTALQNNGLYQLEVHMDMLNDVNND